MTETNNESWEITRRKNLAAKKERVLLNRDLVVANMKRLIQLLENSPAEDFRNQYQDISYNAEIKAKMKELRRDTIRLEKDL